jgi:hypothetical protein
VSRTEERLAAEGWHRILAHLDERRPTIAAVILPRDTDVFAHAVHRAAVPAKPLTRSEKRAAVVRLVTEHSDWSTHRLAEVHGVSRPFVARLRAEANVAPPTEGNAEASPSGIAHFQPPTAAQGRRNSRISPVSLVVLRSCRSI